MPSWSSHCSIFKHKSQSDYLFTYLHVGIMAVQNSATVSKEFFAFLQSVDVHVVRPQDFLLQAAAAFLANGFVDKLDLVGATIAGLSPGALHC